MYIVLELLTLHVKVFSMMKFQTNEGKIFNAISFNRFITKMEQGTLYVAKVILDGETWVVNSDSNEKLFRSKMEGFVRKFKQPVKICKVDRYIDEYESKELYELTYNDCIGTKYS